MNTVFSSESLPKLENITRSSDNKQGELIVRRNKFNSLICLFWQISIKIAFIVKIAVKINTCSHLEIGLPMMHARIGSYRNSIGTPKKHLDAVKRHLTPAKTWHEQYQTDSLRVSCNLSAKFVFEEDFVHAWI